MPIKCPLKTGQLQIQTLIMLFILHPFPLRLPDTLHNCSIYNLLISGFNTVWMDAC